VKALYCNTQRTYGRMQRNISKRKLSREQAAELEGKFSGDQILRTYRCSTCGSYHVVKEYIVPGVWLSASKRVSGQGGQ
jgi:hypothetical protein